MLEITPNQLRNEARKLRELATKYEELAVLLEKTDLRIASTSVDEAQYLHGSTAEGSPLRRGEALRKVIIAAAKFGSSDFSPKEIADALKEDGIEEKTVFAVFQRKKDELFEDRGQDPTNKKVTRYRLRPKEFAWVFTYGINMDEQHLREAFTHNKYDDFVIAAVPAILPDTRLSWRNESKRWGGATATIDPSEEDDLPGIAYLVKSKGVEAFREKERPNYASENRQIIIDGHRVQALVFNVVAQKRHNKELKPARDYLERVISVARSKGFPETYLQELQHLLKK